MISRRVLLLITLTSTAALFFALGAFHARTADALDRETYDAKLDAIRAEVRTELARAPHSDLVPAGTFGRMEGKTADSSAIARARIVSQVKEELESEMGLLPVQLLRARRPSFRELYST